MYQVKLEKFEGPLDLLLQLIEKQKLNVTEISLANVADQYLEYITQQGEINPELTADFLVVAAQLLLIKSKALLPELELSEDEELSIEELQERLKEYKRFKEIAKKLKSLYFSPYISFEQRFFIEEKRAFSPGQNLNLKNLLSSYHDLLCLLEKERLDIEYIPQTISLKEKIAYLQELIFKKVDLHFHELLKNAKTKLETIVYFLALLELVKQKVVQAKQEKLFDDIIIQKNNQQLPLINNQHQSISHEKSN